MAEPPRLLDRMRGGIRTRHYGRRTEETYVGWVKRFIFFHNKKHPAAMGADEVNAFLTHLAVERRVGASTQSQALCALIFLYRHVLDDPLRWMEEIVRAQRRERLPLVLDRDEVRRLLGRWRGRRGSLHRCFTVEGCGCSRRCVCESRTSTSRRT